MKVIVQKAINLGEESRFGLVSNLAKRDPESLQNLRIEKALENQDFQLLELLKKHGHPLHLPGGTNPLYMAIALSSSEKRLAAINFLLGFGVDPRIFFKPSSQINASLAQAYSTCNQTPIRYGYSVDEEIGKLLCQPYPEFSECVFFNSQWKFLDFRSLIHFELDFSLGRRSSDSVPLHGIIGQLFSVNYQIVSQNKLFESIVLQAIATLQKFIPMRFNRDKYPLELFIRFEPLKGIGAGVTTRETPSQTIFCNWHVRINSNSNLKDPYLLAVIMHEFLHVFGFSHPRKEVSGLHSLMSYRPEYNLRMAPWEHRGILNSKYWENYRRLLTPMSLDLDTSYYLHGDFRTERHELDIDGKPLCIDKAGCVSPVKVYTNVSKINTQKFKGDVQLTSCENEPLIGRYHFTSIGAQTFSLHRGAGVEEIETGRGNDNITICNNSARDIKIGSGDGFDLMTFFPSVVGVRELTISDFNPKQDRLKFENCSMTDIIGVDNSTFILTDCQQVISLPDISKKQLNGCTIGSNFISCRDPDRFFNSLLKTGITSATFTIVGKIADELIKTNRLTPFQAKCVALAKGMFKIWLGGFWLWAIASVVGLLFEKTGCSAKNTSFFSDFISILIVLSQPDIYLIAGNFLGACIGSQVADFFIECAGVNNQSRNSQSFLSPRGPKVNVSGESTKGLQM